MLSADGEGILQYRDEQVDGASGGRTVIRIYHVGSDTLSLSAGAGCESAVIRIYHVGSDTLSLSAGAAVRMARKNLAKHRRQHNGPYDMILSC